MKEGLHPSTVSRFINHCLLYVLEQNKKKRRAIGTLLKEMVRRKLFDSSDILEGWFHLFYNFYMEVFLIVLAIFQLYWTLPIGWRFHCGHSQIVGICGRTGWASVWRWRDRFGFLTQLSSILKPSLVVDFLVAVLKELVNTLVITKVCVRWLDAMGLSSSVPAGPFPVCLGQPRLHHV